MSPRQPLKRKDAPYGVCYYCRVPLVIDEDDPIRFEGEQVIRYNIICPVCGALWLHLASKPGPWKVLVDKRGAVGRKCPTCGEPNVIPEDRERTYCPCGTDLRRDGRAFPKCERCGHRHQTERSAQVCEAYTDWREEGEPLVREVSPVPEGSMEPGRWHLISWPLLREAILKRDEYTCQDCGYSAKEMRRRENERWEELRRRTEGMDGLCKEYLAIQDSLPKPPDFSVHHTLPRKAGGSNDPRNLITVCDECHVARHNALGGFDPYPEVLEVLKDPETPVGVRRAILEGKHPLAEKVRQTRTREALSGRDKQVAEAELLVIQGRQRTLDIFSQSQDRP